MSLCCQNDPQKVLAKPLSRIQAWIIERLTYKDFEELNSTHQANLWPFFTSSFGDSLLRMPQNLRRQISYDTVAALEICGLPTFSYRVARDEDVEVSDQTFLFCCLIHHIPRWLADTTLLGRYAITGESYAVALLCTSRYILRLPKDQLVAIRYDDCAKFSNSMTVARRTFSNCMKYLPQSMELYFFVLYMYTVIVDPMEPWNMGAMMAISAGDYLLSVSTQRTFTIDDVSLTLIIFLVSISPFKQMRTKFPYLSDPASPEYKKAQASAEATWIETKRDLYDPILSIRVEQLPDFDFDFDLETASASTSNYSSGTEDSENTI